MPKAKKNSLEIAEKELQTEVPLKRIVPAFLIPALALVSLQLFILGANATFASTAPVLGLQLDNTPVSQPLLPKLEAEIVKAKVTKAQNKKITIKMGQTTEQVTPAELGINFDPDVNLEVLKQVGRTGSLWDQIIVQDQAFLGLQNKTVAVSTIDETTAGDFVQGLASKIGQAKKDAAFTVTSGKATILADQNGLVLEDIPALLDIKNSLEDFRTVLVLPVKTVPADLTADDLKPLLTQVNQIVSAPLSLSAAGQSLSLTPDQINSVLIISKPSKGKPAQLSFDADKVNSLITTLAKKVNVAAQAEVTDGTDTLSVGKDGQYLDTNVATKAVLADLNQKQHTPQTAPNNLTLTVNPVKHGLIVRLPKTVYLTFDDGPGQATNQILDELRAGGAHATFFLIGYNVVNDPGTVRRIVAEGNTVGNHTYDHVDLRPLSPDQIRDELARDQDAIYAACGVYPKVFRAPYSFYSDSVKAAAASLALQVMSYTVDTGDWELPGVNTIVSRAVNRAVPGSIIIMHVDQQTADALPSIISGLKAKGFKFRN